MLSKQMYKCDGSAFIHGEMKGELFCEFLRMSQFCQPWDEL